VEHGRTGAPAVTVRHWSALSSEPLRAGLRVPYQSVQNTLRNMETGLA
jgi:hypothetical protein